MAAGVAHQGGLDSAMKTALGGDGQLRHRLVVEVVGLWLPVCDAQCLGLWWLAVKADLFRVFLFRNEG